MSTLPCLYCDGPIPTSEAERASLCPLCSRPLTVCGRFRLKKLLSKSETDRVYAASDGTEEAAVKVWLARDDDWSTISEFERIGRTLQSSKNRNLPQIFGWEKGGQGRLIVAREQLRETLDDRLQAGARPPNLRKLLEELLQLMSELHRLTPPLLHRDIRASNVLFRSAGDWSPVLVDFDPRSGNATTTTDLSSLGRVVDLAAGGGLGNLRPLVERLANGGFGSADAALAELRQNVASPSAPAPRPPGPRPKGMSPRSAWALVIFAVFVIWGFFRGMTHRNPEAVRTNPADKGDSTVESYRRQCNNDDWSGCYNLGYRYEKGKGIKKDEARAATLYRKACDNGDKMACNNLAVLYESGRGVKIDPLQASTLYARACDQKDWLACRNLGYLYSNGVGVAQDVPRAMKLYELACNHSEIRGCYNLGVLYETGKGVAADNLKAVELYRRACDGSDWEGCTNLGWMYAQAKGVAEDQDRAHALYEKACTHEDARGCNNLGVIFEKGRKVAIDYSRAFGLYQKACDGDDYFGCCNLGYFYENGKGVSKDLEKATINYQKSCRLGYDKGCQYFQDMVKDARTATFARGLLQKACDDGDNWSCQQVRK